MAEDLEHFRIAVGRSRFDHGRKAADSATFEGIGQRAEARAVLLVAGHEKVVVVKHEDVDATIALQRDHFVGHRLRVAHAVALARPALLVPSSDATKRAVGVAAAARYQRCNAMAEAARGFASPVGPAELG